MVHGGLHTLPAVSSPVTLNVLSCPFSYAVGPSVVGRGLHALALCWCMCVGRLLSSRFAAMAHSLPPCIFLIPLQSLVCAQCWSFGHPQQWRSAIG
jgi:hypothetical protein